MFHRCTNLVAFGHNITLSCLPYIQIVMNVSDIKPIIYISPHFIGLGELAKNFCITVHKTVHLIGRLTQWHADRLVICGAWVSFCVVSKYVACANGQSTEWIAVNEWEARKKRISVVTRVSDIKCLQFRVVSQTVRRYSDPVAVAAGCEPRTVTRGAARKP